MDFAPPASADDARKHLAGLNDLAWAIGVLSAAYEAGLFDHLREPRDVAEIARLAAMPESVVSGILDVLSALGLVERTGSQAVSTTGIRELFANGVPRTTMSDLGSALRQTAHLAQAARNKAVRAGWHFTDPEILEAQGVTSGQFTDRILNVLAPQAPGLADALGKPGARFLDVGTGCGHISIEMCRRRDGLFAVGLEPAPAPMERARANVAAAGLEGRVELRAQRVEDLADDASFDFTWFPTPFFPAALLERGLSRVFTALKPGGWVLLPAVHATGPDLNSAVMRFLNAVWGGDPLSLPDLRAIAERVGFSEIVTPGGPPGSPMKPLLARRPPGA
jgi:SAM-dependent methyltransferase